MLQKFKYIQSLIVLLFVGAWMLQSITPLVMHQTGHTHNEVMACSIGGDCNSSCSIEKKKACGCNHTSDSENQNNHKICGCSHHGNSPMGTVSPFQIKAPLLTAFEGITFSKLSVALQDNQQPYFIYSDDIFHPPRLNA